LSFVPQALFDETLLHIGSGKGLRRKEQFHFCKLLVIEKAQYQNILFSLCDTKSASFELKIGKTKRVPYEGNPQNNAKKY
jgi:hypothetical protein